jgi:VWFA-related protein
LTARELASLESDSSVIYCLDPDSRISYCNAAWDRFATANNGMHLKRPAPRCGLKAALQAGIGCLAVLLLSAASFAQDGPVFRTGTRLVQVDVVVRDKKGSVLDLTKDDFKLYVCNKEAVAPRDPFGVHTACHGKLEPIQVFHAPAEVLSQTPTFGAAGLPPSTISNRFDSRGEPVRSATVVLFDQLNTSFDHKGYERKQVAKFLRGLSERDRVAIYALGRNLHVLQDFTEDPEKLVQTITKLDSGFDLVQLYPGDDSLSRADESIPGPMAATQSRVYGGLVDEITVGAVRNIVRHMSGVQGRKNLIWLKETPQVALLPENSRKILSLLRGANIALYPVMVRGMKSSGIFSMPTGSRFALPTPELRIQQAARDLGVSTGGAGFTDAGDLRDAVARAEEDSASVYTLGFYPSEAELDGRLHQIAVVLSNSIVGRGRLEMHYRNEYLAARREPQDAIPTIADLFNSPLEATGIALTAEVSPDRIDVTVTLSDIQLEHRGDRWIGSLRMSVADDRYLSSARPVIRVAQIDLSEEELQTARTSGYVVHIDTTGITKGATSIRIVVQDPSNGASGSLWVAVPQPAKTDR